MTNDEWAFGSAPYGVFALHDFDWVRGQYETDNTSPLARCFDVATELGASTVVVEPRYIDLDYRSEFVAHYARSHEPPNHTTHRLHFFQRPVADNEVVDLPDQPGYVGYIVVRPLTSGRVSRAMLAVPDRVAGAVRTAVKEDVSFFGQELRVEGVPFAQQDSQLGACAHAAAWVCHVTAAHSGAVFRRVKGDFSTDADSSLQLGRPIPSQGLTVAQLGDLLNRFGLPPEHYDVKALPSTSRDRHKESIDLVPSVVCRHLNSGQPVLIGTHEHAFVLCGYERTDEGIYFVRHDDARGPYLRVDDWQADTDEPTGYTYGEWLTILAPMPEKIWLPPIAAEVHGLNVLAEFSRQLSLAVGNAMESMTDLDSGENLSVRTYAIRSNDLKADVKHRLPHAVRSALRLVSMPRYVWVVEISDRRLRTDGDGASSSVIGEVTIDPTSPINEPRVLSTFVHGLFHAESVSPVVVDADPYRSGIAGAP